MALIDTKKSKPITFVQISDSHLFSDPCGLHHGHNVLANLKKSYLALASI